MIVNVNGINLYYKKVGQGKPLLFLHGNGEDSKTFDSLTDSLKAYFTCYLIDSRNHGNSTKDVPLHYEDMSLDIYHFITKLQIKNPIIFGFSDGAIMGMILASKYPQLVSKLILAGGSLNPNGVKKTFLKQMEKHYEKTKNPLVELMLNEPHITSKDLLKIVCPTLILAGQYDVIRRAHTKEIHKCIIKSELIIVKNHTHESYIMHSNYLKDIILNFQ